MTGAVAVAAMAASIMTARPNLMRPPTAVGLVPEAQVSLTVSAQANPWLAGMGVGQLASVPRNAADGMPDRVPNQAAVAVNGLTIVPGSIVQFVRVGGTANVGQQAGSAILPKTVGPEGDSRSIVTCRTAPENRIANVRAPLGALMGVFLTDAMPTRSLSNPSLLDFSTFTQQTQAELRPGVRQVFYIGNGSDAAGLPKRIIAPPGATRLFLGTMDTGRWSNNVGGFQANITVLPPPQAPPRA